MARPSQSSVDRRSRAITRVLGVMRRALRPRRSRSALLALLCFRTAELATWVVLLVWAFGERGTTGTGIIAVAQLVPATLVAPLGSVAGDRWTHRRALIAGFLMQTAGCVITWIALVSGASFAVVCACAAFLASSLALTRPAYYAALPDIADGPDELTALNSVSGAVEGFSDFLGPAIAAVLMATVGLDWVLIAMAGATLLATLAALTLPVSRGLRGDSSDAYLALLRSGAATLFKDRSAALLTLLVGVSFLMIGMLDVLGVVLALEILETSPAGPGLLSSAIGVGAIAGASATVVLIGRRHLAPAVLVGSVLAGVPVMVAATSNTLPEALGLFAIAGAGTAFLAVATRTLTQRVIPPQVLTRVFGLQEAMLLGGTAVGALIATGLVAALGPSSAFIVGGLLLPLAAVVVWPWIRRLDGRSEVPGADFDLLRGIPMFAALPQARLELLARELVGAGADAGQAVVSQGEPGDRYYLIESGSARVLVDGAEVRVLESGSGFGEIALLRRVPRTATVQATTPLVLKTLDRDTFLTVVTGSPATHAVAQDAVDDALGTSPGQGSTDPS